MKILMVILLALLLYSCTYTKTSVIDSSQTYTPTSEVKVLQNFPNKPYKQIAIIEGVIAGMTYGGALQDMIEKSKALGADALVLMPSDRPERLVGMAIKYQ